MDDAAAGGGEEKAKMKVARSTAGMAGGAGEFSYTRNSSVQSLAISILKPILEQEIMELEFFKDRSGSAIRMADFGCSVGANAIGYAEICYQSVCRARLSSGRKIPDDELQYFFCDLPSNDFNTLFLQLEDWRKTQTSMEDFYAAAVPGSFYRRLFPKKSLHVAVSTQAIHWMSQVPDLVLDKSSPAYNKGRVWIEGNKNVATVQAFKQAARKDLCNFLLSRADEVISGGFVLFYAIGCANNHPPKTQSARDEEYAVMSFSEVFEATWEELVIEGIIEEERRDTFNIPIYKFNVDDVKEVVESTNAFHIKRCEIKGHNFLASNMEQILNDPEAYGQFIKNGTRSLLNSIMVEHIGEDKCHKFFERYERNIVVATRKKKMFSLPIDCILVLLIRK